jgi:hypothetical protein
MAGFEQRVDGHERIILASFQDTGESGVEIARNIFVLILVSRVLRGRCGKIR